MYSTADWIALRLASSDLPSDTPKARNSVNVGSADTVAVVVAVVVVVLVFMVVSPICYVNVASVLPTNSLSHSRIILSTMIYSGTERKIRFVLHADPTIPRTPKLCFASRVYIDYDLHIRFAFY